MNLNNQKADNMKYVADTRAVEKSLLSKLSEVTNSKTSDSRAVEKSLLSKLSEVTNSKTSISEIPCRHELEQSTRFKKELIFKKIFNLFKC